MPREKVKFALRITPETLLLVRDICPKANCRSQSEFIEKAIRFYAGYVETGNSLDYLAPILASTLTGIVHDSEKRISRLQFKQSVEQSMLMRIIADGLEIDESRLPGLRAECVRDVRSTNGSLSLEDEVRAARLR